MTEDAATDDLDEIQLARVLEAIVSSVVTVIGQRWQPITLKVVSDLPATRSARAHVASAGPHADGPHADGPHTDGPPARSRTAARLALAVVVGVAVGAVTEWLVPHLPFSLEPLGNSAGPWVLVTFAVALTARRMNESLTLGVLTLIALVLGFYVAQAYRGWSVSWHQVELWSVASVVIGPLIGLAAGWLRHAGRTAAALGAGVLGGLLAGEAVYGLRELKFSSPADYWHVQFVLGAGFALGLTLWRSRRHLLASAPALAVSLAAGTAVALVTAAVYQVP